MCSIYTYNSHSSLFWILNFSDLFQPHVEFQFSKLCCSSSLHFEFQLTFLLGRKTQNFILWNANCFRIWFRYASQANIRRAGRYYHRIGSSRTSNSFGLLLLLHTILSANCSQRNKNRGNFRKGVVIFYMQYSLLHPLLFG